MTRPSHYPTGLIWDHFYEITQVPRPSKKEKKIREYLIDFANSKNLKHAVDKIGNVIIFLPATKGYENKESVIIQNHMDMVTDATPDRDIDFDNDPIALLVEDGWVTADRTTLGADNGIGCAAALALVDEKEIKHPPLELLFTVDEETGLNGAINLDASLLSGKKMINLDTEEWGALYIGCAGGIDYELEGSIGFDKQDGMSAYEISLKGLKGGHSGIDIHTGRGNAITILINLFNQIDFPFDVVEFIGGKAHNIIPRDASVTLAFKDEFLGRCEQLTKELRSELLTYLPEVDHGLEFLIKRLSTRGKLLEKSRRTYC